MTITEIGCMGVKPGLDIMDDNTPEGKVLTTAYNAVTVRPSGPQNAFWGLQVEDPTKLWAFFDFESVEAHMEFGKLHGVEIVKDLPSILTHSVFMKHLALTSSSPAAFKAPLTEIIFVHFPGIITEVRKTEHAKELGIVLDGMAAQSPHILAVSWGWSVENDFPSQLEGAEAGSVLAGVVGWHGVKEQEAFRTTAAYHNAEVMIKSLDGIVNFSSVWVLCRSSERK
ncbi:hypothetical protein Cob_v012402 [Colletotrichum orbiculare MAFF 240422]|uniref:ABM domain-containing protein n=1 Tax=Colletotrichum orbiculare (strain 104-T / ATCC 96160 / CBS 514.97 / LARS 414 / MAFF 240422) TaxID=1213857 RepID=N4VNK5_COLOR|nr:hypothetical protein Cob_v012402 [Colletotrichum orbiculare MAFF 240422]